MHLSDLLTPWILLAAVLIPLVYAEKWIHSHLYGVGWLLTNENRSATVLYYLILFPGVFVHEFTQYLMAGALNVATKRMMVWPEAQEDGTLRLDFVQIKKANRVQHAIIGATPLIAGMGVVWLISNRVLNLEDFLTALGTGEVNQIGPAIRNLGSTPDFYLWLYLMFAVSNAMFPTPADRKGWPLLIGLAAVGLIFLVVIGVGDVLLETFTGPVAHGVNLLTTAFGTVLAVEVVAILAIGFFEEILERTTKRKFQYSQPSPPPPTRKPGSNLPLPPGEPLPSIYNLELPVPDPSEKDKLAAQAKRARVLSHPDMPARPGVPATPSAAPPDTTTKEREPALPSRPEAKPAEAADRLAPASPLPQRAERAPAGQAPEKEKAASATTSPFRSPDRSAPGTQVQSPGFEHATPGPERRTDRVSRPARSPFQIPRPSEEEASAADEEQSTGAWRSPVSPGLRPAGWRSSAPEDSGSRSPFILDDDGEDVDEDDYEDELEYTDFDDAP